MQPCLSKAGQSPSCPIPCSVVVAASIEQVCTSLWQLRAASRGVLFGCVSGSNNGKRCSQRCCHGFACSVATHSSSSMHVLLGTPVCMPVIVFWMGHDQRVLDGWGGSRQGMDVATSWCISSTLQRRAGCGSCRLCLGVCSASDQGMLHLCSHCCILCVLCVSCIQ